MSTISASTTTLTGLVQSSDVTGQLVFQTGATPTTSLTLGNNQTIGLNSSILEAATITATAASGTVNYDAITQSVLYSTANATGNWVVNVRGSSSVTLDSLLAVGQSMSLTYLTTQSATAYYNTGVTIDGASVTVKWQGGTAPASGNASSLDVYTYVIIKTASATYTVLGSQTKFA
jgi:hypothetical protein